MEQSHNTTETTDIDTELKGQEPTPKEEPSKQKNQDTEHIDTQTDEIDFTAEWNTQWVYEGHGNWQQTEQDKQMKDTKTFKTATTLDRLRMETENPDLLRAAMVREKGYPNRFGARIPVPSKINIDELEDRLQGYEDREVVEWMRYGWPTGRLPTMADPDKTFKNHKGATDYPQALERYIDKEMAHQAVIGPLQQIPFPDRVGISPISTRPKKCSTDRRIIIDLSFPQGASVNDGMIKDNYLGWATELRFPRTDDLALRIFQLGTDARMFKIDLSRYFRQLPLDPGDYSLIGYVINDQLYFDKVIPMGMRTAPYIAQRVTNAIRHIHEQLQFFLLNYVDDFLGAEHKDRIWKAYEFLTQLLRNLRIDTAPEKVVQPTSRIEFLGTIFDSQTMTIEVPPDKMEDIKRELGEWEKKTKASRKEMESLIGKLQFAARCVRAGRVFISRMINWLRGTDRKGKHNIPTEAKKDIAWWREYMATYNGVSIMWLHKEPLADKVIATDSCKKGFGGIAGEEYFRGRFPKEMQQRNIAELEIIAVIIALKIWGESRLKGQYFWIHVDNEAVATVINSGASRNTALQQALREIAKIAATHEFVIKAKHIPGISNRIPDWLSRYDEIEARKQFIRYAREKSLKRRRVSAAMLISESNW